MSSMQAGGPSQLSPTPAVTPSTSTDLSSEDAIALMRQQELFNKLASWVNKKYTELNNARVPYERQWHINISFYNGRQNVAPVTVAGQGFRLMTPKAPPWRVRQVTNKIRTAVRTECSKLSSSKPIPVVIPATTEDEDLAASRVAENILKSDLATDDHDAMNRSWIWWGVVTGNSFIKSYWNPSETDDRAFITPDVSQMDPKQVAVMMMLGMDPMQPKPAQGKICYEAISPFHVFVPDLLEPEIEKQSFVMHVMTKTPEYVQKAYGFNPTPDSRASQSLLETAVLTPQVSNQHFDSVLVKEVWIKPGGHPHFPEGGLITVCNDRVVQYQPRWPVPFKEYPFYRYEGIPTGGFYYDSIITDLIPLQKEYNRTRSQAVEIKNTMGKPKLMGYRGSFNPRQVNSEPGQAILITPGYQFPIVIPGAEVPASLSNEMDRLISDFDDISGQHEITRGNTPSQVTSGTAISFLQEQDDSKLHYQVAGIERATAKLGRHHLKYATTYWEDERLVKIVGRDGDFEAQHWKKSAMQGNTDVIVQSGSALPFSKAAKQALLTDLMDRGFIDPQSGLEIMDLGGLDKVLEDFLVDKRHAQRENLKMASLDPEEIDELVNPPVGPDGEPTYMDAGDGRPMPVDTRGPTPIPWTPQAPLPVNSWDNHEVHIKFHNQFRKTQQFELLDENIKKAFELHVQTHQMALGLPQMGQVGMVANQELAGIDPNAPEANPDMQAPPAGEEPTEANPEGGQESAPAPSNQPPQQ